MKAAIHIKRVYDPPDTGDGTRVLVDRLWPRGLTKEAAAVSVWLKEVAPTTELRKWFHHEPANWQEFEHRYRAELRSNEAALEPLRELVKRGPVTLLYGAHDTVHNQAVILADYLQHATPAHHD